MIQIQGELKVTYLTHPIPKAGITVEGIGDKGMLVTHFPCYFAPLQLQ